MNVPNHERKAFRDMTPEEMGAIAKAVIAGDIEYWSAFSRKWMTPGRAMGGLDFEAIYRTRSHQLVIPWEHIKEGYKWAAMDKNGGVYFFEEKPLLFKECWVNIKLTCCMSMLKINTTGIDWRESLTARPEGV